MGGALARGLVQGSCIHNSDIHVSNPSMPKLEALKAECPQLNVYTGNVDAARQADMVVLAVKPWKIAEVVEELKPHLDYSRQVVASMVGGLGTAELDRMLDRGDGVLPTLVCLIPNTAIAVLESMTFFTTVRSNAATDERLTSILSELGAAMLVEERQMNAGMAVASCGIAFAMRYIRAAMEGGVQLGLRPNEALAAVLQTVKGAAVLLGKTGGHPEAAIDCVTTAGGITIRGLNAMEEAGFTGSVVRGLMAAKP